MQKQASLQAASVVPAKQGSSRAHQLLSCSQPVAAQVPPAPLPSFDSPPPFKVSGTRAQELRLQALTAAVAAGRFGDLAPHVEGPLEPEQLDEHILHTAAAGSKAKVSTPHDVLLLQFGRWQLGWHAHGLGPAWWHEQHS